MHKDVQHFKLKKSLKRRGLLIIILLALIGCGFLIYAMLSDSSGSLVGKVTGGDLDFEDAFILSAEMELQNIKIKNVAESSIKISLSSHGETVSIEGLTFNNIDNSNIILKKYTGAITINKPNFLYLDGKMENLLINDVEIEKEGKTLEMLLEGTEFESLEISDLALKSLSFKATGEIDVPDRGSFILNDEKLEIKPFIGKIIIEDSELMLEGKAKEILIDGVPKITVD